MQKYKIRRALGDGTFGTVFEAISPSQEIVAIKKMKQKYNNWQQCCTLREIKSLRKLDHPNIIKLKQVILAQGELYLVFDYLETNLLQMYTRAQESKRMLTQSEIKSIFFKTVQGLAFLHKNGYFHRDLKPENILCHNLQVKICDFGLARQIRSRPPFTDYVSTRWYRAPQLLLRSTTYNSPVDIFALACIIVELFTMQPLFPGVNQIDTLNKIVEVLGTPKKSDWPQGFKLASTMRYDFPQAKGLGLFQIIPKASPQIVELLESMLCYSSRKRPSANDILKHSYFQNFTASSDKQEQNQQMKISFYDKNIVEMPKNMKIQNPKEIQMRKSMYKFGDSFSSSFHKQKEKDVVVNHVNVNNNNQNSVKKVDKKQKEDEQKIRRQYTNPNTTNQNTNINLNPNIDKFSSSTKKPAKLMDDHQDISKKFDQMQQILLELKKKQQMKSTNNYNYNYTKRQKQKSQRSAAYQPKNSMPIPSISSNQQQQLRLRMYSLDGGIGFAGSKSISNINININGNYGGNSMKNNGPLLKGLSNTNSNNNMKM